MPLAGSCHQSNAAPGLGNVQHNLSARFGHIAQVNIGHVKLKQGPRIYSPGRLLRKKASPLWVIFYHA